MRYLHTNNASSNLRTAIGAVDTTLQVTSGQGVLFPNPVTGEGFYVTVEDRRIGKLEIMLCTARVTDTLTVTRGQQGTVPQSFVVGVNVSNRVTAKILNDFTVEGEMGLDRIPMIPDAKIIDLSAPKLFGTINALRLPNIPRDKMPSLNASALDIGTVPDARLPNPLPPGILPDIPSAKMPVVLASSITGVLALANIPVIPDAKLDTVAASRLTGIVANARISGSYTNFVTIQGTGDVGFNRYIAPIGAAANPPYTFGGAINGGFFYSATTGVNVSFGGTSRLSVNDVDIAAIGGASFKGPASGLTDIPAAQLTGSVPVAALRTPMNATVGTAGLYAVRSWAKVDIVGTTATVQANGNIPTVVHQGGGVWRASFSLPMPDNDYSAVVLTNAGTPAISGQFTAYIDLDLGTSLTRLNIIIVR